MPLCPCRYAIFDPVFYAISERETIVSIHEPKIYQQYQNCYAMQVFHNLCTLKK
jgi:hypothetical protein